MRKASPNQRLNNGQSSNRKNSLSGEKWLDNDKLEYGLSDEQSITPYVFAESNGENSTGLCGKEERHGLPEINVALSRKSTTQIKSDDISMLWHELVSPLTLIKGYTTTMLQLSEGITEEQRHQYLRGIDSASNRMVRLLEDLRDASRLEENRYIIARHISLRDLLRQVLSEMQNQAKNHVIVFRPGAPLPRVNADPEKIAQVVNNFLTNAIKYSPGGGDIEVEAKLFRSDLEFKRILGDVYPMKLRFPCLIVSVADSGIGVPEAELEHIFDKFYRVKNNLTRTVPGLGLGLYICKMIIEAHHGHIWAGNRLTGGTIFYFSLPVD